QDRWHYLHLHEHHCGMTAEAWDKVARSADVFLNVSGASMFPDNLNPRCIKVFLDTDPGYNQIVMATRPAWSENVDRWVQQVRQHDRHLTYAENLYGEDCILPRLEIDWRPTRCVVTMNPWEQLRQFPPPADAPFTTVMTWTYFKGPLIFNGVQYGAKAPEYDKFHDLPKRVKVPLALAVSGHTQPAEQIKADGWIQVDAKSASLTPQNYVDFIRDSAGEWSVAKNCYVATRSGWFSCRTACYLAAGRPAVVQETGWSRFLPSGEGLIAFSTMQEAIDGLHRVSDDPHRHRNAAWEIAREYLAPDRVLPPMLEAIYAPSPHPRQLPPAWASDLPARSAGQ
ncbi:MAG: hypothetical protein NZ561_09105, partial [Phycisphaerae bacterium]|nr:hypothetical protein [Phycisphaerae bacterium]MDW8262946.1 hypothetical protein [Phycisphaerales bacterium]